MAVSGSPVLNVKISMKKKSEDYSMDTSTTTVPFYRRLSTLLILFSVTVSLIPLWWFGLYSFGTFKESIQNVVQHDLQVLASSEEALVFSFLSSLRSYTTTYSSDGYIRESIEMLRTAAATSTLGADLSEYLVTQKLILEHPISQVDVIDTTGVVVASTKRESIGTDGRDEYFEDVSRLPFGDAKISDVQKSVLHGEDVQIIEVLAVLTSLTTGESLGVVKVTFRDTSLVRFLSGEQQIALGALSAFRSKDSGLNIYIVNEDSVVISDSEDTPAFVHAASQIKTKPVQLCQLQQQEAVGIWKNPEGEQVYGASTCLAAHFNWTLVVEVPESQIVAPILLLRNSMFLFGSLMSLFILFFSVYFAQAITRPLKSLSRATKQINQGVFDVKIPIESRNEIGLLAGNFEHMRAWILEYIDSIEEEKKHANNLAETLGTKVEELHRSQSATLNILEDLDTEKKVIERTVKDRTIELTQEKDKLNIIAERMTAATILFDAHGQVLFANKSLLKLLNFKAFEATKVMEAFFAKFTNPEIKTFIIRCALERTSGVVPEIDMDGRVFSLVIKSIAPDHQGKNHLAGNIIFIHDITDEKLLERSKSELVAVASHQLRTPLTAIRGNVEMLTDESYGTLNEQQKELLDNVAISTIRLIAMVNDMLDITKIEAKTLELNLEDVFLDTVIDSVIGDLSEYAFRNKVTVQHNKLDTSISVHVDKLRVRQVFQNLIDNAIKYSNPSGSLTISYVATDTHLTVTVADDGIGIPVTEQSKLFGRFYRASNTVKVSASGSGLGLYIVKSIVESLRGSITFTSKEAVGTTFAVALPRI